MLYGAAAREFRLRRAGGVDAVIEKAAAQAARDAVEAINGVIAESIRPAAGTAAARPSRSNTTRRVHRTKRAKA